MKCKLALAASGFFITTAAVVAGPQDVALPANYKSDFIHYQVSDHFGDKKVRKSFVDPKTEKSAVAGLPLPDGSVLLMEDYFAKVDAEGNLVLDENGRMIATDVISGIVVMEKNAAWSTQNGQWDYAVYDVRGNLNTDVPYQICFDCHQSRAKRDFNFTYWKYLQSKID